VEFLGCEQTVDQATGCVWIWDYCILWWALVPHVVQSSKIVGRLSEEDALHNLVTLHLPSLLPADLACGMLFDPSTPHTKQIR
jgi:hypothetical protein